MGGSGRPTEVSRVGGLRGIARGQGYGPSELFVSLCYRASAGSCPRLCLRICIVCCSGRSGCLRRGSESEWDGRESVPAQEQKRVVAGHQEAQLSGHLTNRASGHTRMSSKIRGRARSDLESKEEGKTRLRAVWLAPTTRSLKNNQRRSEGSPTFARSRLSGQVIGRHTRARRGTDSPTMSVV